jgi:hypothetical protein
MGRDNGPRCSGLNLVRGVRGRGEGGEARDPVAAQEGAREIE